jgi:hypothetical protein
MSAIAVLAKTILALVELFNALMRGLSERRAIKAGEDAATAHSLKEQTARVEKARAARRAVDADRLPDDDPDRRD